MHASLCISLPIESGEKCYGMLKNADSGSVLAKKSGFRKRYRDFSVFLYPELINKQTWNTTPKSLDADTNKT